MRPAKLLAFVMLSAFFGWITQHDVLAWLAGTRPPAVAVAAAPDDAPGAIDPTPYRDAIDAIEAVLYRGSPAGWSDPETVSAHAMALGDRLYADLGPLRGHQAMAELVDYAGAVGMQAESGYSAPELDGPRAGWEAFRAKWFRRAPWFGRTTAQLVAAQRPPAPTASLIDLHELWKWAGAIETMVEGGRPALARYGELHVDAAEGSQEERDLVARFQSFATDWDERVRGLGAQAPRRPAPEGEPNLLFAYQALEEAVAQLALATTSEGDAPVPMKWWRTQCLDAAAAHLEAARGFLSRAHTGATTTSQTASLPAAPTP
jgi:hypothetical protein